MRTRSSPRAAGAAQEDSGDVLLSQGDTPQVPSALAGLTSVFGMGTGVTPPLWSPEILAAWPGRRPNPGDSIEPPPETSIASTSHY